MEAFKTILLIFLIICAISASLMKIAVKIRFCP